VSIKIDGLLAREKCGNCKKRRPLDKESEEEFIFYLRMAVDFEWEFKGRGG